jgi:hypothetical protein
MQGIEMTSPSHHAFPIMLSNDFTKADVPPGTEVWSVQ